MRSYRSSRFASDRSRGKKTQRGYTRQLRYEALEDRRLLTVTPAFAGDVLTITIAAGGVTDADLTILAGAYQVNGAPAGGATTANTHQIHVIGYAGPNSFTIEPAVTLTKGLIVDANVVTTTVKNNITGTAAGFSININSPNASVQGTWQTQGGDVDLDTPTAITLIGDWNIDTQTGTPVNAGSVFLGDVNGDGVSPHKLHIDATGGAGGLGGTISLNDVGATTFLSQLDALTSDTIFLFGDATLSGGRIQTDGPVTLKAGVLGVSSFGATKQTIDTEADGSGNGGDVTLDIAMMAETSGFGSPGLLQINTAPGAGGVAGKVTLPPAPGFVPIGQAAGSLVYQDQYGTNKILVNTTAADVAVPPVLDFGDAPSTYKTLLADDGARHVATGVTLGSKRDVEADGQPNATATGDDTHAENDDDGVIFTTSLIPGQSAVVQVTLSQAGLLDAWIDFNANGNFADAADHVFTGLALTAGPHALTFAVPGAAVVGNTFARFRVSSSGTPLPTGLAADGEVEDYLVPIVPVTLLGKDWGDAPDTYKTLSASGGPSHVTTGNTLMLGTRRDSETDGQPNPTATGDDAAGGPDDEDGVTIPALVPGTTATLQVVASQPGILNAWIDYDGNGAFANPSERVITDKPLVAGNNAIDIAIPATATLGTSFARFRLNSIGGLAPDGPALDGEVEDYRVSIQTTPSPSPSPGTVIFTENFNAVVSPLLVTQTGSFVQSGNQHVGTRSGVGGTAIVTVPSLTTAILTPHYQVETKTTLTPNGPNLYSNGFIIFDYQSPTDFKYAGAFGLLDRFVIGQVSGGRNTQLASTRAPITAGVQYSLRLEINGSLATLYNGAAQVAQKTFTSSFTGSVGYGTINANSSFDDFTVATL